MSDKYHSAKQKLKRANKHRTDFHDLLISSAADYKIESNFDRQRGMHFVEFISDVPCDDFSLILGDAMVNLRCAIDYCYAAAIGKERARGRQFGLKITKDKKEFLGQFKGPKAIPIPSDLCRLLVEDIKPYKGGNDIIWGLNQLANIDKHRMPVIVSEDSSVRCTLNCRGMTIAVENIIKAGAQNFLSSGFGPVPEFITDPVFDLHIKIAEPEIEVFNEQLATSMLDQAFDEVNKMIESISRLLPNGSLNGVPCAA